MVAWAVDTVNAGSMMASHQYRSTSAADAAILQETKASGPARSELEKEASASGWIPVSTDARESPGGGRSAGAAVLVKNCFSAEQVAGLRLEDEPHRACFASTPIAEGCILISMYLKDGEGMSPHNKTILEQMAAELAGTSQEWIIGTDANMPPEDLISSGWLDLAVD